jgi:hypothetical protein
MNLNPDLGAFAGIEDHDELGPKEARAALLAQAKRGYVPIRKTFVQRPKDSTDPAGRPSARASVLYDLVHSRNHQALDLFLLIHALQPILSGSPLELSTWAHIMSTKQPVSSTAVSRAIATLEKYNLVVREDTSRTPVLRLKREDGSNADWTRPGAEEEEGPGYFVIPHAYWNADLSEDLTLPGKALFLILLHDTQNPRTPAFAMAVDRAQKWYGISERTAERGYRELDDTGYLQTKIQKVADPRHPAKRREVYWRALGGPFSTNARIRLQRRATRAARKAGTSTANLIDLNVNIATDPTETNDAPEATPKSAPEPAPTDTAVAT